LAGEDILQDVFYYAPVADAAADIALKTNFKAAFGAKMSNGEFIDTYSILGNTLTGSTSGPNAHDVFTLTLYSFP